MITLSAEIRKVFGRKTKLLKKAGKIPAIVYGPGIKNILLEVNENDFQKVFKKTGENSLVELEIGGEKEKRPVLIHEIQRNPVTDKFAHVDFFQPSLKEEVEVKVPLVFEGMSSAVKDLGGTLIKNITELGIKSLPQNIPHEIRVSVDKLNTFEDHILIKDLSLPNDIKVLAKTDEIVVSVAPPAKIEEELEKPIEEKVEEVEKVEKEKKEEAVTEDEEKK